MKAVTFYRKKMMMSVSYSTVNSLPNDKILDWSKFKAFADEKINVNEKLKFGLARKKTL